MDDSFRNNAHDQTKLKSGRGRGKNKIYWNEDDIMLLIRELQELANDPMWKIDCGFKNKYMVELHKRILLKDLSFTKEVDPHIESKLKWLKTKYHAISEMIKESGCTWNDQEHKIQCEKEWYDNWVKVIINCCLYNRKRKHSPMTVKEPKKMKTQESLFADATKEFTSCVVGLSNHFKSIAGVTESEEAREAEISNRKKNIIASLGGIGLSRQQTWAAADVLALHSHKLEVFSQLEENDKYAYIVNMLS